MIIAANWKMYLTHAQEWEWYTINRPSLEQLATSHTIILFPSYLSLHALSSSKPKCFLGAQNCSGHVQGSFTGQISAQALAELGCTFCIVGHHEQRHYFHENESTIEQKMCRLLEVGIIPLVCIGETRAERDQNLTQAVLDRQCTTIVHAYQTMASSRKHALPKEFLIAYEPTWAIGTGVTPSIAEVQEAFSTIEQTLKPKLKNISLRLLYGGSVTATNAPQYAQISNLDGFLIGGASINFQSFENIVGSVTS